ncbi:MAG: L-lactate permease [Acidobacteriota bacterium]|nr:L-lactate permease [Acidobacteriota bacterium]
MHPWPQPVNPLHYLPLSALAAAAPLALLLVLMGWLRKSSYVSAAWGLLASLVIAAAVWGMPLKLAAASIIYGGVYALWPIMWIVLTALWLYNLAVDTGKFGLLRNWMADHASGDLRIQAILVAFCFGALLEGTAGFGTPVAVTAFLLVGLGFAANRAVTVALIANTAPVAFGAIGIPVVALAGVTGLPLSKLSSMIGRQLPFLSLLIPAYLVWVVAGRKGLKGAWPAAAVGGCSFALAQFIVSNLWGPYAADIIASLVSIVALVLLLRVWAPRDAEPAKAVSAPAPASQLNWRQGVAAWTPWVLLAAVMILWSYLRLFQAGRLAIHVPWLHNAIFITLYHKPYAAIYNFEPLAAGTAALVATLITAIALRASPRLVLIAGLKTLRQLLLPGLTVVLIVALAYLYNYSGMAFTLGAALAALGGLFPLFSGFLGWVACFMSGSDTASNILFGNLQVAAAHQIGVNPVLLAATNSSGAVTGKMISPQNIAVGVTTVDMVGQEGDVLRSTFWHSILFAVGISLLALAQAYWLKWMVP